MDHCSYRIPETPFIGSQELERYRPPQHTGLEISQDRLLGLIAEADHYAKLQQSSILSQVNGPDCLAVCVAHQVASSMHRYNLGLTNYIHGR